jgi:hypothetical protein
VNNLLDKLLHSALAADAMMGCDFRKESDLTPEERAHAARWRAWARQPRPAVFVSTGGKTKAEIVRDVAAAMRQAGMLKE